MRTIVPPREPLSSPVADQSATSTPTRSSALTLGEALDQWFTYLRGSDRIGSPRTLDAYAYATGKLLAALTPSTPLSSVKPESLEAFFADLKSSGMSPGGRSAVYRPIKTFFRWCVKRGLIPTFPMSDDMAPKVRTAPVEFVDEAEWQAILATCQPKTRSRWQFRNVRDLAILLVLGTTGARLSEVANLTIMDVDMNAGTITVMGKGGKPRLLPILPEVSIALVSYLRYRSMSAFSTVSDRLWLASKGPFSADGIAQMVRARGKEAGIVRGVHPHELRHRFVSQTLAAGMPAPLVMALTGHQTPSMLNRYGAFNRSQDAMAMWRELSAKRATA